MIVDGLRALADALDSAHVGWFLFGAQAVVVHGTPRLTADVDATIVLGDALPATALGALERFEIVCRTPELRSALESSRLWPMVHTASHTPIDIVIAGDGIDRDFLARAISLEIAGRRVRVLAAEDLIATKAITGRRKDREDIIGVLEAQGARLDLERLRRTLDELDASLEEPRARRRFERMYRDYMRRSGR